MTSLALAHTDILTSDPFLAEIIKSCDAIHHFLQSVGQSLTEKPQVENRRTPKISSGTLQQLTAKEEYVTEAPPPITTTWRATAREESYPAFLPDSLHLAWREAQEFEKMMSAAKKTKKHGGTILFATRRKLAGEHPSLGPFLSKSNLAMTVLSNDGPKYGPGS